MMEEKHVCKSEEGCVISSTQATFSVYGDRTNYLLQNPNKKSVSKYIVDDCLLAHLKEDEKCDYLFVIPNNGENDGYFVELKGSDTIKAINQLINSINRLKGSINGGFFGRIVCSKFPQAPATKRSPQYLRLMKLTGRNLIIKSQQLTESI
jgi:hypothetical protein